jgi:hypothetical protein
MAWNWEPPKDLLAWIICVWLAMALLFAFTGGTVTEPPELSYLPQSNK